MGNAGFYTKPIEWNGLTELEGRNYVCGYCGNQVGPNSGYRDSSRGYRIYICSFCRRPTYFQHDMQVPGPLYAGEVDHLPEDIAALYREARACMTVSSYTAAVLICRKLLMNIAVSQGASTGKRFIEYVDYLAVQSFVPPNGRAWVDKIRKKGNEATHEIQLMERGDAEELISFVEMLLKFIYEFPGKLSGV